MPQKRDAALSTRQKANKELRRESLREELKSREYIRQIHGLLEKDYTGMEKEDRDIAIKEAQLKLNGYAKLLNKTLPDVKSIEVVQRPPILEQLEEMTEEELINRLADIRGSNAITAGADTSPGTGKAH